MYTNKFGVEYHGYTLELADGREINMDVGYEDDWGNVQLCAPDEDDWYTIEDAVMDFGGI